MFYYLQGKIAHKEPHLAVVDVAGAGYACHTSLTTLSGLDVGREARLYTYLHVREGIFELYGFATQEELSAFKMLLGISGVGPRAALAILSVTTPERLALSVLSGDEKALTAAAGVGKKLAQRVVLELKDKMGKQLGASLAGDWAGGGGDLPREMGKLDEARAALGVLGYAPAEAAYALKGVDTDALTVEQIIRAALKNMVRA
ncbi:MAG: Holliday junction branch migration protein RuvA [Oscillospiraceae bacterium]|jgi:Holliday junction DNA helicase RuvA|nr:Holliday junction branch migration protein RuvA [Oscillospiraceae bacterium]